MNELERTTPVEDVRSLDKGHVRPTMGNIFARGICARRAAKPSQLLSVCDASKQHHDLGDFGTDHIKQADGSAGHRAEDDDEYTVHGC